MTGPFVRPLIASAAGETATIWRIQGIVPEEEAAFRRTVAGDEKQGGNKIDLMPFQALNQKVVAALTSADVPDLIFHDAPQVLLPRNAWNDKRVDMSDVVESFGSQPSKTSKLESGYYSDTRAGEKAFRAAEATFARLTFG